MKNKTFTRDEMILKFESLSYRSKTNILWYALDLMQQYNGRSKYECVFMVMNYQEDDNGMWHKYIEK